MVVASPIAQYVAIRTGRYFDGFPNSLMGVLAYVRQLYLDLAWHQKAMTIYSGHVNGLKRPPYDHYLEGLAESPRLLLPASQSQQIDRMIAFGNELKQPYVLYGLPEGFARIDELRKANIPVMVSLKWPVRPPGADPVNVPDYRTLMMRDQAPSVPGLLAKAGVRFGFFSDGLATAGDLRQALKKSLDAGLKREDAIRALTLNTAEIYGVADRLGSVDRGKIANLVVTKGDAFDDKTPIEYVFVDGQEFQPRTEPGTAPSKGGVQ